VKVETTESGQVKLIKLKISFYLIFCFNFQSISYAFYSENTEQYQNICVEFFIPLFWLLFYLLIVIY
jgi:hypothetical protein